MGAPLEDLISKLLTFDKASGGAYGIGACQESRPAMREALGRDL